MKSLKSYSTLPGASLLESVIAISIIGICTIISMIVFSRTLSSSSYNSDIEAEQQVKALWLETQLTKDFSDNAYKFSNFSIKKEVKDYDLNTNGRLVYFTIETATNKKRVLTYFAKE